MTREEAIKVLEQHTKNTAAGYKYYLAHGGYPDSEMDDYLDAMYSALDALREQSNTVQRVVNTDNALTNADHVRSMSDKELAELFEEIGCDRIGRPAPYWLEWLKQPYKEDA